MVIWAVPGMLSRVPVNYNTLQDNSLQIAALGDQSPKPIQLQPLDTS